MAEGKVAYFLTMRRCPKCGRGINTNGKGDFVCYGCGYRDHQDVSKLLASDLTYPVPRERNMTYGKGTQVEL